MSGHKGLLTYDVAVWTQGPTTSCTLPRGNAGFASGQRLITLTLLGIRRRLLKHVGKNMIYPKVLSDAEVRVITPPRRYQGGQRTTCADISVKKMS